MNPAYRMVLLALAIVMAACVTEMKPVSHANDESVRVSIAVGDTVRVLTKYGDRPTFEVTSITDSELIGGEHRIPYTDMAFVEKRTSGTSSRSVMAVALLIVGGAVVVETLGNMSPVFPGYP